MGNANGLGRCPPWHQNVVLVATAALAGSLGCAGAMPGTPVQVATAQREAIRVGDLRQASSLLTPSAIAQARPWPQLGNLPDGSADETARLATWQFADGRRLTLQRDAAGWRVKVGVLGLMGQDTPGAALRSFGLALEAADIVTLQRFIPIAERQGLGVDVLSKFFASAEGRALRAAAPAFQAWDQPLAAAATDNRVIARFDGGEVELIREGQGWKVYDVRLQPKPDQIAP